MNLREQSLDQDQLIPLKSSKKKVKQNASGINWIVLLLASCLITISALFLTFVVNSNFPGSYLTLPFGIIISFFLGLIVFFVGTVVSAK